MTPDNDRPSPSLSDLVQKLTDAVQLLSDRFRRKRVSDGLVGVAVVLMLLFGVWYFVVDLPNRRKNTQDQFRDFACYSVRLNPPGYSGQSDDLRKRYECPAFDPADASPGAPTVQPSPGATVTRLVPAPRSTRTVTRPATSRSALPGPTVTRTVTPPARTVTVRPPAGTRTVVRNVPGPTVTRGVCLPLLCRP